MKLEDLPQSPLKPTHDYVVCALVKPEGNSILSTTGEELDIYVVAVGPGRVTDQVGPDGQLLLNKPTIRRGDRVHVDASKAMKFELYGHRFIMLNHFNILGIVDETVESWLKSHPVVHLPTSTVLPNQFLTPPPSNRKGGGKN